MKYGMKIRRKIYYDICRMFQKLLGKTNEDIKVDHLAWYQYFGQKDYGVVTVILKDNVVVDCIYGAYDEDAMDWANDFGWQEKE